MKKLVSVILALCLAMLMVSALAEDALTGVWYLVSAESAGVSFTPSAIGMEIVLTMNEDGTFTTATTIAGQTTEESGTWTATDTGANIKDTTTGDEKSLVLKDGSLVLDMGEEGNMIFGRTAPEAPAGPETVAAESADQFNGVWKMTTVSMMGIEMNPADLGMSTEVTYTITDGQVVEESKDGEGNAMTEVYTTTFQDGKLVLAPTSELEQALETSMEFSLLADGNLLLSSDLGGFAITMTFAPAEAAEAPAA